MFLENKILRWLKWFFGFRERPKEAKPDLKPTVTTIIPAYNEAAHIASTIRSLKNQTYPIDRIVVVDDCSEDGTGALAQACDVEVIRTPQRSGTKARAQNYALPLIESDLLITVDADTLLHHRALEEVVPYFSDSNVASVCGFVIPQKIETFWEKARLIQYLYYISLNKGTQDHWGVPLVSSGCFSVFNVKLLKEFGGFPNQTMAEDMDLTWRFLGAGKKVRLAPQAICYPLDPSTYQLYRAQVERWYRSFLQNIALHRWRLFKNRRLTFFIGWYLISGLLTPAYWALTPLVLVKSKIGYAAFAFLVSEFLLVGIVSLFRAWRLKKLGIALRSLPNYWLVSPLETYLFLKSVWLEWVRRKRLVSWEKGH